MPPEFVTLILGFFIGLVLALTGAGGAILSIPLLVFFLHLDIAAAAPIGLLSLSLTAGLAALLGLRADNVRYKAAALMAICGVALAPAGVWLGHILPSTIVGLTFATVLAYSSWRMWHGADIESTFDNVNPAPCQVNPTTSRLFWTAPCTARLGLAGSLAGLLSGLLGVGGGFVIVPTLRKVSNFDMQTIVATSLATIALVSLSGFLSYAAHGAIDWKMALLFSSGTLIGMLTCKRFFNRISARTSQRAFATLALIVAVWLAIKYSNLLL